MKAVKSGRSFNLFTDKELSHIKLEQTDKKVMVDGVTYSVYRGATFHESEKVDDLLDEKGEMAIRAYRIKEPDRER